MSPNANRPDFDRVKVLFDLKRYDDALKEVDRMLAQFPNTVAGQQWRARILMRKGAYKAALEVIERAIASAPDDYYSFYLQGYILKWQGRPNAALASARESLRLRPNDAFCFGLIAQIEYGQGNNEETLEAAEAGLRVDPRSALCLQYKSRALVEMNRLEAAETPLRQLLSIVPDNAWYLADLGDLLDKQRRFREAEVAFESSIRHRPTGRYAKRRLLEVLRYRFPVFRRQFDWKARLDSLPGFMLVVFFGLGGLFYLLGPYPFPFEPPVTFFTSCVFAAWIWTTSLEHMRMAVIAQHPIGRRLIGPFKVIFSLLVLATLALFLVVQVLAFVLRDPAIGWWGGMIFATLGLIGHVALGKESLMTGIRFMAAFFGVVATTVWPVLWWAERYDQLEALMFVFWIGLWVYSGYRAVANFTDRNRKSDRDVVV